jgi:hypothetical protein
MCVKRSIMIRKSVFKTELFTDDFTGFWKYWKTSQPVRQEIPRSLFQKQVRHQDQDIEIYKMKKIMGMILLCCESIKRQPGINIVYIQLAVFKWIVQGQGLLST